MTFTPDQVKAAIKWVDSLAKQAAAATPSPTDDQVVARLAEALENDLVALLVATVLNHLPAPK